jgi:hypothetical protein
MKTTQRVEKKTLDNDSDNDLSCLARQQQTDNNERRKITYIMAKRRKSMDEVEAAFEVAKQALGKMGLELADSIGTKYDPSTGRVSVTKGSLTLKANIAGSSFVSSCEFFDFLSKHASHTISHVEDMVEVYNHLTGSEAAVSSVDAAIAEAVNTPDEEDFSPGGTSSDDDEDEAVTQRHPNSEPKALAETPVSVEDVADILTDDVAAEIAAIASGTQSSPEPEVSPASFGSYTSSGGYTSPDSSPYSEDEEVLSDPKYWGDSEPQSLDFDPDSTDMPEAQDDSDELFNSALADQLSGLGLDSNPGYDQDIPDSAVA